MGGSRARGGRASTRRTPTPIILSWRAPSTFGRIVILVHRRPIGITTNSGKMSPRNIEECCQFLRRAVPQKFGVHRDKSTGLEARSYNGFVSLLLSQPWGLACQGNSQFGGGLDGHFFSTGAKEHLWKSCSSRLRLCQSQHPLSRQGASGAGICTAQSPCPTPCCQRQPGVGP